MKKPLVILAVVAVLVVLGVGGFFAYKNYFSKETTVSKSQPVQLDPEKEATHLSKVAGTAGVYWMRGMPIVWNNIEKKQGEFDWTSVDDAIIGGKDGYFAADVYHIAMIWPYANWDQETCHSGDKYKATGHLKEADEELSVGKPCNMTHYADFLTRVVERYDGDGTDDASGLRTPIKYWEIMNEPEMQGGNTGGMGEELKFFVGSSQEYFSILKTSYETIKKADPGAKVAHGGMAGMHKNFVDFWAPVFELGAGKYFDIANIHSISTTEKTEDLFVVRFKRFLEKYGVGEKPIWVTEAQYGGLQDKPENIEEFDKLLARSAVFALAQGADKLFFIENWTFWGQEEMMKPPEEKEKDKGPKPKLDLSNNTTHKVYLNLVNKINSFEKVEALNEKYYENPGDPEGATTDVGHYKFINGSKVAYVLWGKGSAVAPEIAGKLIVTDIYGESREIDVSALKLSDSPLFVELKK